ncbi:hypothetical protein T492DRAFT_915020, partial [Pavlovales sp. CCMP2436]
MTAWPARPPGRSTVAQAVVQNISWSQLPVPTVHTYTHLFIYLYINIHINTFLA